MKKLFTIVFCMLSIVANAEQVKMALLQPRVAEGSDACRPIELNMVRGELRKAFTWQSDFQVLTRTDVDAMLEEHGFQRSGFVDDKQRKEVGVMTGAQYICVSTITKDGTQLYIESYLVEIETGQMTNSATQFANIQNNDYSTLQEPCNKLAKEMLGELGGSSKKSTHAATPNKSVNTVANNKPVNQVPNYQPSEVYEEYVDLGLPSGTLWKSTNEDCGLITHEEAMNRYGNNLPTKEQCDELVRSCTWTWTGNGYRVIAPNRKSIFFAANGYYTDNKKKKIVKEGEIGLYWSSTPWDTSSMTKTEQKIYNALGAFWGLRICQDAEIAVLINKGALCSVRLVR